jgi:hypothetical protein
MADEEHIALLEQGVDAWNKWCEGNPDVRADLSKAHLPGVNISRADLSEPDFSGASDQVHGNLVAPAVGCTPFPGGRQQHGR